jgi:hypothetical protein
MSDASAEEELDEPAPLSQDERTLSQWLRRCDQSGAIPESRAGADVAYAMGHAQGIDEGHDAHLESLRTLLVRILEANNGELTEATLDQMEGASSRELEDWIVRAALGK